ncbi:flavin reductase (DIM6/NTAB) family NADH-FMN oxidoreductase RutF [Paraburkholderia sp. HC6.4b]|uniref:flavin reductase family protein n=1 Tax=unclassified Paraburkholderia TaxID=2615204 RepID=UPI0016170097|nr:MULTISPECIES: flavin reductase [unclassified Paraburkholderia]MBB5406911.1 flavin reductase (DIM6/NTAB) family NADH-FMN oxidoreductase RutF [Paraburkholderia sp. HC6.4b]MBB5449020.1 flavin reductase (DIM6/NTAB) family NADH-FMN oxidoreductase RutF [Paraburkholderia sp. Kb1A]
MNATRETVELSRATQLLNHGPVTLITSAHDGRSNVMAASWAMPLDFNPPKVVVVVDSRTLTRRLIEASGVFGLQLPSRGFAAQTLAVGTHASVELDNDDPDLRTCHYVAGGTFFATGDAFELVPVAASAQ